MFEKREILRQEMRVRRASLSAEEKEILCWNIQQRAAEFLESQPQIQTIMTYFPIHNEAEPLPEEWIRFLRASGKTFLLPRMESTNPPVLAAVIYEDTGTYTSWGIFEPDGHPIPPSMVDCVFVPGLAFDQNGYRLGYGKGFYDAFLPLLRPDALTIGIGYQFQLTETTWPKPDDMRLKAMLTDEFMFYFPEFD